MRCSSGARPSGATVPGRPTGLPSVSCLDLMLPDGSGVAILELVRREVLPVRVALATGATVRSAAQAAGPDALFRKPLDLRRLTAWLDGSGVAGLCRARARAGDEARRPNAWTPPRRLRDGGGTRVALPRGDRGQRDHEQPTRTARPADAAGGCCGAAGVYGGAGGP